MKRREVASDFGEIVPACSVPLRQTDCIEWQVGYDLLDVSGEGEITTLPDKPFLNYANIRKLPSELSELLYWSKSYDFLTDDDICNMFRSLDSLPPEAYFDQIWPSREDLSSESRNGILFQRKNVVYPLFVCDYGTFSVEIMIREQQYGSGIQPMLYLCIPVSNLEFQYPYLERPPRTNQEKICRWIVKPTDGRGCLYAFLLLGMLSARHRHDTLAILRILFPDLIPTS